MEDGTRFIGIDLHRRRSQVAVVDSDGEVLLQRRIANDPEAFRELLGEPEGAHVALEATYGWEWLADFLQEAGYRVALGHPLRTKAIAAARVKTDAVDARTLADLLRAGMLPQAYIAPPELRDVRELLRHRQALTGLRTMLKNRVHALLARHGIALERSDLFTGPGLAVLRALELPTGPKTRLESLLSLICDFDRELTQTTREIERRAKLDERVQVLTKIRGVGRYTAMLVISELGDVHRFPTAQHACSWAGLTPTVRASDRTARYGHISRQGSPALRAALVEAAQMAVTGSGPLRASFERIAKRRGRKIAKVAVARQILALCYYGLRDGEIRCLNQHAKQPPKLKAASQTPHKLAPTRAQGGHSGEPARAV